jgi:ribosomal protein L32
MNRRELECGCTFVGDGDDWRPCRSHAASTLARVRKAQAEVVEMETCSNCFRPKVPGETCFQCGVGPRIGGS